MDDNIKILVLGDRYVGKTSLINRFINNTFNPNEYDIIGLDSKIKELNIENKLINVQIWISNLKIGLDLFQLNYFIEVLMVLF